MLGRGAEPHHRLDARAIVPRPVEQRELPGPWQVLDIALEIPLRLFAIRRLRQGDGAGVAHRQVLGDALDRPVLAGRVPAFEDHQGLAAGLDLRLLELHQGDLQLLELVIVVVVVLGHAGTLCPMKAVALQRLR